MLMIRALLSACLLVATCDGYYIPGVSSKTFNKGERVKMRVSKLTSIRTQLPYSYYWLPYPHPKKGVQEADEHGNLGTYLTGHDVNNSPYELKMLTNEYCKMVQRSMYTKEQMDQFRNAISKWTQ
jgi:transmembrane 9 superfamily protein 2/4